MSKPIVLTDGECRFCKATLAWVEKKLTVDSIAFQVADLSRYGLSFEECSKALHVVNGEKVYVGADSIAFLLGLRGNWITAMVIRKSGPLGRFGYRWVAEHRNSLAIRLITRLLEITTP